MADGATGGLTEGVLDALGEGVLVFGAADGSGRRLVRANGAARALLDLPPCLAEPGTPLKELLGHWVERGDFGPGDPADRKSGILAALSMDRPRDFDQTVPGGRLLAVRARPLPDGGLVLACRDDTALHHVADDLRTAAATLEDSVGDHSRTIARLTDAVAEASARAEEGLRDKARTLALVNHALRGPVGAMLEPARILLAAPLGLEENQQVAALLRSLDALRVILDDLGDLVRVESDAIRLDEAPFSVETVTGSVVSALSEAAAARGRVLEAVIDPRAPATLVGDAAWLRHVLVELVGRAVRDAVAPGITLRVAPAVLPDGRPGLRFAVGDAGPDAAEELRAWLQRGLPPLDGALCRQGWRGLGLHIARRIVALMGGTLGVETSDETGEATLWFTAALASAAETDGAASEARPSLSILVVEDNPVNQRVNAWLLRKDGHRVAVVADGREAVDLAGKGGFDAVLMDLDIPGLDGIAATRAIRALPPPQGSVPIIAITGSALPDDIARCRAAGMDNHLPKPVNPAALTRVLGRLTVTPAGGAPAVRPLAEDGFDSGVLDALEAVIGPGKVLQLVDEVLTGAGEAAVLLDAARADADPVACRLAAAEVKAMAGTVGLTGAYRAAVALEQALCNADGADADFGVDEGAARLAQALAGGLERLRARREELAPLDAVEVG